MTQPKYAPIQSEDQVREAYRLQTPLPWVPDRPSDFRPGARLRGRALGTHGPDQGYVLNLLPAFEEKVRLGDGESFGDVGAVCTALALRRAASYGRAPVGADLDFAFTLTGCLGSPPAELVDWRLGHFGGLSHDYFQLRSLVEAVPDETFRVAPARLTETLGAEWRNLLGV